MKATKAKADRPAPTDTGAAEANLSLLQAAARLGVSPYTLRAWARYQGRIAYVRMGRRILFRPSDLEAFTLSSRVAARE